MDLADTFNVSRETFERLSEYVELVKRWNPKINLVSKSSIDMLWDRHIWDSAQIFNHAPIGQNWLDIGSGGGFPALVVAIMAKELDPHQRVTMIESDTRKAVFLRTVIRELDLNASVLTQRIEQVPAQEARVLSARALADLNLLLNFAERHLDPSGVCLFMKGETWKEELAEAQKSWRFSYKSHPSLTNSKAAILEIKELCRV